MIDSSIFTKKIEFDICSVVLYWQEVPEFKLKKIVLLDKPRNIVPEEDNYICHYDSKSQQIGKLEGAIFNYFNTRKSLKFNVQNLDFSILSKFTIKVLLTLLRIPLGKIITYKMLAAFSGSPSACRAVGSIMSNNLFPLLIPCHRVIRSDFHIGAFHPGVELKKKLLRHELMENVFDRDILQNKNFLV